MDFLEIVIKGLYTSWGKCETGILKFTLFIFLCLLLNCWLCEPTQILLMPSNMHVVVTHSMTCFQPIIIASSYTCRPRDFMWCSSWSSLIRPLTARSALDGTQPLFTQVPPTTSPSIMAVFNPCTNWTTYKHEEMRNSDRSNVRHTYNSVSFFACML